jgi:hypothetical protein
MFIFGLVSQNIPISDWAHFTVSLVTTRCCFFWHWTGDGFDPLSGVVVLCLSPTEVQCTLFHWREQVWGQECWIGEVHQKERCCKSSSCSKDSKCKLKWRTHGNNGHPKGVVKNDVDFECYHCGGGTNQRLDV